MKTIKTYIVKTESNEYYCSKTNDIERRFKEHLKEEYPQWFNKDSRRNFIPVLIVEGNFEDKIKSFGIKN